MAEGSRISSDRWKRIELLFESALDRPAAERAAFLSDAAQGDVALRAEVEALLAADQRESAFIKAPLPPLRVGPDAAQESQFTSGSRIGAYQIVRPIASGGMGRVYLAERTDRQYEKRVAVKVIKRGMDTDEVVRRFRAERQTLANLDHPNIARLLDGGMTEDGLPYLVMDYIEGRPIDAYCDERRLSTHQRLKLFCDVCAAVDYAHRNLVIHRDLKPANILVADVGAISDRDSHASSPRPSRSETAPTAQPKIIDFGIAKVLDTSHGSGSSLLTLEGFRPMTPEYASPEQVRGEPITTVSDVYSLGVILYELLSGHRPYRFDTRTLSDMQRVICEQQPEPPSTVVGKSVRMPGPDEDSTLALTPEAVSRARDVHPRRLRRLLAGDLDNIVLTSLRKEPQRRYASVRQLSDDIDCYLRGLPVMARRDSWSYRTTKWVRRQPALAAMIALVVVTLVAGVVGMTWTTRAALSQRDTARRERDRADLEARKARQINSFVQNMLASVHPEREGLDVTVREVLDQAAARLQTDMAGQPLVEAEVRGTMGQAYHGLGLYGPAEAHLRSALALLREGGGSDLEIARARTPLASLLAARGEYYEAASLLEESRALFAASGRAEASRPDEAAVLDAMATVRRAQGRTEEAEPLARHALDIRRAVLGNEHLDVARSLTSLAVLLQQKGNYAAADELYREAVDIKRRRLGGDHPLLAEDYNNWGELLRVMAKNEEAERVVRHAVDIRRSALGPEHPALATSLSELGLIVYDMGRLDEAEALYREALDINRKALGPDHPDLGGVLNDLAGVLRRKKDYAGAEALYREALAIIEKKFGRRHHLAGTALHNLGRLYQWQSKLEEAEAFYREAADIKRETLGSNHPELVPTLNNLGALLLSRKEYAAAIPICEEALQVRRATLPPRHPGLENSLFTLARVLNASGDGGRAEPLLRECLEIRSASEKSDRVGLAQVECELGESLTRLGRLEEAEPFLSRSFDGFCYAAGDPGDKSIRIAAQRLVNLYEAMGLDEEAEVYRDWAASSTRDKP